MIPHTTRATVLLAVILAALVLLLAVIFGLPLWMWLPWYSLFIVLAGFGAADAGAEVIERTRFPKRGEGAQARGGEVVTTVFPTSTTDTGAAFRTMAKDYGGEVIYTRFATDEREALRNHREAETRVG